MPEATPVRTAGTRPRILHLVTDPRRRGAQNLARDLHRELRRRGQASALRALAPHPDAHPDAADTRATAVLGPGRLHPRTLAALRTAARTADLVVAHGSTTLPACALALAGTRTPFVYVSIGDPRHWTASPLRRLRTGTLLRRAAAVTALADEAREVLVERFRLPAARVRTIPNARAADRYPPAAGEADRRAARQSLGLPPDGLLVAWLGSISPRSGWTSPSKPSTAFPTSGWPWRATARSAPPWSDIRPPPGPISWGPSRTPPRSTGPPTRSC